MKNELRRSGRAAASFLVAFAVSSAVHAQQPSAGASDVLAEVIVTGSRIARNPNDTAPLPISSLDIEDLRAAGATDVTATLRQIPALLSSSTVADSIERGPAGTFGQAVLNLRQLGSNRTLVLVDGQRHVSGIAGSQAVDVATIPRGLIERIEVLTGGASAIYGADAVTGVVNYVLKKDFEGLSVDLQSGISSESDGVSTRFDVTFGRNFADGRGNITLSANFADEDEVLLGVRSFTANNGHANNSTTYGHPARRFQKGQIDPGTMPNFAEHYRIGGPGPSSQDFPFGVVIPTPAQAATMFPGGLTPAEQALVDGAAGAPQFMIGRDPRFAISSGSGLIFRNDFGFFGTDLDGNGLTDCFDSYIGRYGFGGGGCYISTAGGGVKIFEDGIISTGQNQFGGDGAVERTNQTSLIPGSKRYGVNLRGRYEFSSFAEAFADVKFGKSRPVRRNNYNTFYDSLWIFPDNPYIPAALQAEADDADGLRVSRDFLDLGPNTFKADGDVARVVAGLQGAISDSLRYELVANYGRTSTDITQSNTVLPDRLFAAIDVVTGPNGQPICRSDIDPTPHPGSEIFPVIEGGFFTFSPGDGQCRPANILNGVNSVSTEAVAFITVPTTDRFRLEQKIMTLSFTGDSSPLFSLPAGAMQFAFGAEYREEESRSRFSDLELGLLPEGSAAGPPGTFIGDISSLQSLVFDGSTRTFNTGGSFDVSEVFAEISVPLLRDAFLARELTVGGAVRYSDYSTIGGATTWNVNAIWAPVDDLRLRATLSEAIRAPNIAELFDPQQGAVFRPADPCNQSAIDALIAAGDPNAQNRLDNCRADGIPDGYMDPLTARFSGTSGGNPNLTEETADTWTVGMVVQPRWVRGLTLSVDYYSIEIEDAIAAVTAQDIVNTCYDIETFPNQFCELFTRNRDPLSQTYLGLNFLQQTQLNYGRIETSGVDFQGNYVFSLGSWQMGVTLAGNWTEKVNRFFDPVRTDLVNPGLQEMSVPEWSGIGSFTAGTGPFTATWRTQYLGKQAVASVIQIERIDSEFGDAGWAPSYLVHDFSGSYEFSGGITAYAGVNNLTNEKPYMASNAYPVSGLGRFFFAGVRADF